MRQQNLSAVKAGITRLRDKGGASPDSLYDLLNGYVTAARTIAMRPGTRIDVALPAGTKGLVWFQDKFVVFSHQVTPSTDPRVVVEVVRHPHQPDTAIEHIHFAMPFLGYLYVVAQFADGLIFHYWLEKGEVWQPGTVYMPGTLVRPTAESGVAYRVESNREGLAPWAPGVPRTSNDEVVPLEDNGFKYTVTDTSGPSPRSGTSEPAWPTHPGAVVIEDADNPVAYTDVQEVAGKTRLPADVGKRYPPPGFS